MLRQYLLSEPDSGSIMYCWLEELPSLKVGASVTLKEIPDRVWIIKEVFGTRIQRSDIKRGWNNNI